MLYYFDYTYLIFIVPAILISIFAQIKVSHAFKKYSKIRSARGITGAQTAQKILSSYGVTNVKIECIAGNFNDHYDPRDNTIRLSEGVYKDSSVAAIGVAAHESGHAVQHAESYTPMRIRNAIVPITNFSSKISFPIILIGLLLPVQYDFVLYFGIILFSACVFFELVNLPVEINASKRALVAINESCILYDDELDGAKKVLFAAAYTYLAGTFASVMQLLRLILLASGRRGND